MSTFVFLFLCLATLHLAAFPHANATLLPRNLGPQKHDLKQQPSLSVHDDSFLEDIIKQEASPEFESPEPFPRPSPRPSPRPPYVINRSNSTFFRSAGVGASVQIGITATIRFSITIRAILATDLVRNDGRFRAALPDESVGAFDLFSSIYEGGLNIPFLAWLGANLNRDVTTDDQDVAISVIPAYRRLSARARRILSNQPLTNIRISGTTSVTGTSFVPRQIFSFIRVANVELRNGNRVQIVSASANDVEFASFDGTGVVGNATAIEDFRVETF